MHNAMTMKWLKEKQKEIRLKKAELDREESILRDLEEPARNRNEAIKRLNGLMKAAEPNSFPSEDIMEELLDGMNYEVKRYPNGKVTYVVESFELDLQTGDGTLMVTNTFSTSWTENLNSNRWKYRSDEDYAVISSLKNKSISSLEAAKQLAEISFSYEVVNPTREQMTFRTIENYLSLKFFDRAYKISLAAESERKRKEERYQEEKEELNKELFEELRIMKANGLYDLLKVIEEDTDFCVSFDIFIGHYDRYGGTKGIDAFINKYLKEDA